MNRRYIGAAAVTKSDSAVLSPTAGIFVGGTGDIALKFFDGSTVTLENVADGTWFDGFCVVQVLSTGTTATSILALY